MSENNGFGPDFYRAVARYSAQYRDKTIVIKFGNEIVMNDEASRNIMVQAINLTNLGANVALVHGGGNEISKRLRDAGCFEELRDGVRPTNDAALDITHSCLNELNRRMVNIFHEEAARLGADVSAIGLGGNDDRMIVAGVRRNFEGLRTGWIEDVNKDKVQALMKGNRVPIIHPICMGRDGRCMNVNADEVAAEIAKKLGALRLILCTNENGVLDKNKQRISRLTQEDVDHLIADGTIEGGMIAKVRAALEVANYQSVGGVVILNGGNIKAIEDELMTDEGSGTLIQRKVASGPKEELIHTP